MIPHLLFLYLLFFFESNNFLVIQIVPYFLVKTIQKDATADVCCCSRQPDELLPLKESQPDWRARGWLPVQTLT